ncbi:MAG: GNAT family N-acetyltransferase [Acidimicrobiales bacterium]
MTARAPAGPAGTTVRHLGRCLHPDHDALLARTAEPSVFLTASWLRSWFEVFGALHRPVNLVVEEGGDLVGAAPLVVRRPERRFPFRMLVVAGQHPTSGEYLEPFARPGRETEVAGAVVDELTGSARRHWDVLIVQRTPADSPMVAALVAALAGRSVPTRLIDTGTAPYCALPADPDALLRGRSRNFRSQVRQTRNRMARLGTVELHQIGPGDTAPAGPQAGPHDQGAGSVPGPDPLTGLDEVIRLHRLRWGTRSSFDTAPKLAFHHRLARRFAAEGRLYLSLLRSAGTTIAGRYDFVYAGKMWCIQGGWDPDHAAVRPGLYLTDAALRWGAARGLREYDFLGGAADYKTRWATGHRPLATLTAANPATVRGRAYAHRVTHRG